MNGRYRKERMEVDKYAKDKRFVKLGIIEGKLHFVSRHDCWILDYFQGHYTLYHKNTMQQRNKSKKYENIPGYHIQKVNYDSILRYLVYIDEHDKYRDKKPCTYDRANEQKLKKKKGKRKLNRQADVIRVLALLEELKSLSDA